MDAGPTAAIAQFGVTAQPSSTVLVAARRAILDTLGVALGGAHEPVSDILHAYVLDQAPQSVRGACQVWGRATRTSAQLAALANATAAHALDFDDISHSMRGRPSAAVVPALIAVAERQHASGADLLAAYAVAVEVECKLGIVSANPSYEQGWQTSCTLGAIGAAIGCGRLLGLQADALGHAVGLAVAQASGSRRSFGSMGKPFQIGHASQAGVFAAELAARGLTGGERALEGEAGYFDLYAGGTPVDGPTLVGLLGQPYDLEWPGFNVKLYPCGGAAHAPIEAALTAARGVAVADVDRIVVDVPFTAPIVAHQHRPTAGLEAKFSLEYCLAAALLDRQVTLAQFSDAAVNRPAAQDLLRRVEVRVPPDMLKGAQPWPPAVESRVELHLVNGEVRRGVTIVRRGQATRTPLTDAELEAKFLDCATRGVGHERALHVLARLRNLERVQDMAELAGDLSV